MKGVSIRQCKLLAQTVSKNEFGYLKLKEHEIIDNAIELMEGSELFNKVGKEIEDYADKLVEEECKPEWNRIIESLQPLNEERNELEKKKATEEGLSEEEDKRYEEITNLISAGMDEYQKVSDVANDKLEKFKEKTLDKNQSSCFLLEDDDYELINKKIGWSVYEIE